MAQNGARQHRGSDPKGVDVRDLAGSEIIEAAAMLGRGMRDNPLHFRAFGPLPDRREAALRRLFETLLSQYTTKGSILGAFSAGTLVGVCGMVEPGRCRPGVRDKASLATALLRGSGVGGVIRAMKWARRWARHDAEQPHWHLGPVGVEPHLQGGGIGSAMLRMFCERMDRAGCLAYLETDKQENLPFYERFGFRITDEDDVLGVRNWFMERDAVPASAGPTDVAASTIG